MFVSDLNNAIFQMNSRLWDPMHAIRILSNFYSQYVKVVTDEDIETMRKLSPDFKYSYYQNLYQLLIYVLGGRKEQDQPKAFEPAVLYSKGNWKPEYASISGLKEPELDEDLLRFNFVCLANEFC